MLQTAVETCTEPFQAVFYVDQDDYDSWAEVAGWRHHPRVEVRWVTAARYAVPMSDMWNHCAHTALDWHGDWPLMFIDDEASFRTPGWDRLICNELGKWPDGGVLVQPNDTIHADAAAGYFAVPARWHEIFGRVTPRVFTYGYADVWCMEVARAAGRRVYLPNVVIENLAPKLQPPDRVHEENYERAVRDRPGDLYNATQADRERDVALLLTWIREHQP